MSTAAPGHDHLMSGAYIPDTAPSTTSTAPSSSRAPRGGKRVGVKLPGIAGIGVDAAKSITRIGPSGGGNKLLVAEFLLCVVILGLSPLTAKHSGDTPQQWMKRAAAICALFFILALVSTGGAGPAKVSQAFGGVVTVALLMSSKEQFTALASMLGGGAAATTESAEQPTNADVTEEVDGAGG